MKKKLSVVVVCITPFAADGSLDEDLYRRHLRRLGEAGVSVYVGGSGSGEGYTLSPEERDRVMRIAVEELQGKVQVRAMGCEPRVIGEMVDFVQAAERAKVDAAQIFSLEIGHALKPTRAELDNYYSTVIDSTSVPIYLSSHQASGYFIPLDLVESLLDRYPSIVGMAYGGTDTVYLAELIARFGDRIEVHCAGPNNAMFVLGLGGNGFMGGEGNFAPGLAASVIAAFEARDMERLRVSYGKFIALHALIHRYGGATMRVVKPLMNAFGLPGGKLRPPRLPVTAAELDEAIKAVLKLDIPGLPALLPPEQREVLAVAR